MNLNGASRAGLCAALTAVLLAAGCGGNSNGKVAAATGLSPAADLGRQAFSDVALSASGTQSCASCHIASKAFTDGQVVPFGGLHFVPPATGDAGLRNTPTLMYASYSPDFFFDTDGTPTGGFFRDGRAATLADQAQRPFTTSFKMANASPDEVVQRLRTRPYLQQFIDLYGADSLNNPEVAVGHLAEALAAFQTEDESFHPFTSKYDFWQAGRATLTQQELNGLRLYNDPTRGNCAACHPSTSADGGLTPPLFTDFTYDNLGVPRNPNIPANDDAQTLAYVPYNSADGAHKYYDMGLCGPLRSDLGAQGANASLCGAFKVPTLRDIALTAPYFHNGEFPTLQEALSFYVTRDTDPSRWYPTDGAGNVTKFDDLEAVYGGEFVMNINVLGSDANYVGNVNTVEIPYNRKFGQTASLSPADIDDVIAFLCTLTDGYDPQHPENYTLPAQCAATSP